MTDQFPEVLIGFFCITVKEVHVVHVQNQLQLHLGFGMGLGINPGGQLGGAAGSHSADPIKNTNATMRSTSVPMNAILDIGAVTIFKKTQYQQNRHDNRD
jgi:hypothetical protein